MTCGFDDIDREILEAVCQDYEPFERVVKRISDLTLDQSGARTAEISERVMEYITFRMIEAYLIHAEPPFVTAVGPRPEMVKNCWLLITPQGERHLQDLKGRSVPIQ